MSSSEKDSVSSPVKYWTGKTLSITDVGSKFKTKEVVKSTKFCCQDDPQLVTFIFEVMFGEEVDGFVSVYVGPTNKSITLTMDRFTLYDVKGAVLETSHGVINDNTDTGEFYGLSKFYSFNSAEAVNWRFSCEVEYKAVSQAVAPTNSCLSTLQNDFLTLLKSPNNADVTFLVKHNRIKAHRDILAARCAYFASMFKSGMKESVAKEVQIKEEEPAVFQGLLEFLYSGSPPKNLPEIALNLLALADKYGLEDLKKICEVRICANLNAENCVDALVVAKRHHCSDLLLRAKSVFPAHAEVLTKSGKSLRLLGDNPDVLAELLVHLSIG